MSKFEEFVRAEFGVWSEPKTTKAYAQRFVSAAEQCVNDIVKALRATNNRRALDVCCGQGIVAKKLAAACTDVAGLDFSPVKLEIELQTVPSMDFVECDATYLPFDDNTFDAVTMGLAFFTPRMQKRR